MKFKRWLFVFLFTLICGVSMLFVGCNGDGKNNNEDDEPVIQIVQISFTTDYGTLSDSFITIEKENGIATFGIEDCPTITNEGNERIFLQWTTEDGTSYNFAAGTDKDITLKAEFEDAEIVCAKKWAKGENVTNYILYREVDSAYQFEQTSGDREDSVTFTKIPKRLYNSSYITKGQYENLANSYCFKE